MIRTTLGDAFDLLALYEPGGFVMERGGFGVSTAASAETLAVPNLRGLVERAVAALEDPSTPVAAGALPFDPEAEAVLRLPSRVAIRRPGAAPELWDARPNDGQHRIERVLPRSSPGAPFEEMQLSWLPDAASYEAGVAEATRHILDGELRKVVLARTIEVAAERDLDPRALLARLRAVDPQAYAFAAPSAEGAVLVGASPELLVSRFGRRVSSNPLAGSASRSGDVEEDRANAEGLRRSEKNREEHAIVVEAVAETLGPFCEHLHWDPEPVVLPTPNVWHLSTRFEGVVREPMPAVLELVAALHPTPAVAGSPRDAALALIDRLEPFDRGSYAGPVGWMDHRGDGEWAIALRCADLRPDAATLYAGAGIVAESVPVDELDETERKFRAFLDALRWS